MSYLVKTRKVSDGSVSGGADPYTGSVEYALIAEANAAYDTQAALPENAMVALFDKEWGDHIVIAQASR